LASWLVLDWDNDQFHVLSARASGADVKVSQVATFVPSEPLNGGSAERVGTALGAFLSAKGFSSGTVVVGVGRDRVFLKELLLPRGSLEPHEEANIVRNQTGRDLTESVDHYVIDYTEPMTGAEERHVTAVAMRKDMIAALQTMCQTAGFTLYAVTPKLFGVSEALRRAVGPAASPIKPNQLNVVLTVGQRWAELCFFKGERLVQAQALANGTLLVGEIKRNLALFQAQHAVEMDVNGPDNLYVFGADETLETALETGQPLPVEALNPLQPDGELADAIPNAGVYAGAVGLAVLWDLASPTPVNLVNPKKTTAPVSAARQRMMIYGAALAVLAIFAVGAMGYVLVDRRAKIRDLNAINQLQNEEFNNLGQERADLEAYKEWEHSSVRWLDELYDLTARFPYKPGFRITQLNASNTTSGAKKGAKESSVGRITLAGVYPKGESQGVNDMHSAMSRDAHLRSSIEDIGQVDFKMKIEVSAQGTRRYDTVLSVPPRPPTPPPKINWVYKDPPEEKKPPVEPDPDDPDPDGGSN